MHGPLNVKFVHLYVSHTDAHVHVDRNFKKSLFSNHPSVSPETKLPIWRSRCGNVLPGQGCHKVMDVYEAAEPSD